MLFRSKKAYQKVKNEPEIAKAMEYYREAEPGAELDELHSIIGTTIGDNRLDSENSRVLGTVPQKLIKGKAILRIYPKPKIF